MKELIRKNPRAYCLAKCIKRIKNDPTFVKDINEGNPFLFRCNSYGALNKHKNIYLIKAGRIGQGFFAEFRSIINYLIFADRFGFIPVIELSSDFEYFEKDGVKGIMNPYEYYFKQPTPLSLEEALNSFNVFESNPDNLIYGESFKKEFNGYVISDAYLLKAADIIRRYIHIKEDIIQAFENSARSFPDWSLLVGVHVRGSDYKREYNGHPKLIPYDSYIASVKEMLDRYEMRGVFLATDDEDAVVAFKKAFGDRLFYYEDAKRTSGDKSLIYSADNRDLHKFNLGYEVLRDVWSLSNCNILVAGVSQVSICAQMFNKASKREYAEKCIINPGLSTSNKIFNNYE